MHQTFYIDVDEEITSIVDRLKKSRTNEVIMVVPKRALLIQSVVNLKLLKKEADNLGKQLMIVTQDKTGKSLIENVGLLVQEKIDDYEDDMVIPSGGEDEHYFQVASKLDTEKETNKMNKIGSSDYFENPPKFNVEQEKKTDPKMPLDNFSNPDKITNTELVSRIEGDVSKEGKKKFFGKPSMDIVSSSSVSAKGNMDVNQRGIENTEFSSKPAFSNQIHQDIDSKQNNYSQSKLDDFFSKNRSANNQVRQEENYKNVNLSGKFWKIFLTFIFAAIILALGAGAYLFLPKADIKFVMKNWSRSATLEIKGNSVASNVDVENKSIPLRVIETDYEITQNYPVKGTKNSAGSQKAKGTITIYNEFGPEPQSLVATTRFESEGGKIFRLTKAVTVPGTSNVGGETKPGAIEAEVIADEPGSAYNIEPSKFTIPGFKDSASGKYSKFYAKSSKNMTGGGGSGDAIKFVSKADLEEAKNNISLEAAKSAVEKVKNIAGEGEVILEELINVPSPEFVFSNKEGEAVDNISITLKSKVSALVFKESDLEEIIASDLRSGIEAGRELDKDSFNIKYGKIEADFAKGEAMIRIDASGKAISLIEEETIKKSILGKNEEDLKEYLKTYPEIESVEINYWPSFLSGKIPSYEKRVQVTIDRNL